MSLIRRITKNIGIIKKWGEEGFDESVHENYSSFQEIVPMINNTIDDINTLLATIEAVDALGGIGLADLINGDTLEWDSNSSKFKNTNLHSKTEKTTLSDADEVAVASSTDSFSLKKITWANIKTLLSSIFIKKIVAPITGALTKINADGTLGNSNVINKDNGNILIGTTTDNGVDTLQVNGTIKSPKPLKFSNLQVITTGDMGNLRYESSIYGIQTTVSSCPIADVGIAEIILYDTNWVLQRFTAMGVLNSAYAGRTFTRMLTLGTTWTAWRELSN